MMLRARDFCRRAAPVLLRKPLLHNGCKPHCGQLVPERHHLRGSRAELPGGGQMKRIFASGRTRWAAIVILIVLPAMLAAYSVFEFRRPNSFGEDHGFSISSPTIQTGFWGCCFWQFRRFRSFWSLSADARRHASWCRSQSCPPSRSWEERYFPLCRCRTSSRAARSL